jgi:small subunit ribosomal protein S19
MTRSVWKGPFVEPSLIKSTHASHVGSNASHVQRNQIPVGAKHERPLAGRKVWSRRSCILPQFVSCFTQIYNGKKWIGLKITEEMVGHKFGEFASTRTIGRSHAEKGSTSKTKTKLKAKAR